MQAPSPLDPQILLKIVQTKMPFGKYKGLPLPRLPEPYLLWFAREGFPEGELGRMLSLLCEIKSNGMEGLLKPLETQANR